MISVSEARQLIAEHCARLKSETVPLVNAVGRVLAKDVYSPIDVPPFDQSAMDGYGIRFSDWDGKRPLRVTHEIAAGTFSEDPLQPNSAVRIFTGSQVPAQCDTIVMQEKVQVQNGELSITDPLLKKGMNIRLQASQTKKGDCALKAETAILPGTIAFLAGLGLDSVEVFKLPRVAVIATGKELSDPGKPLPPGKIYESNSYGLVAALVEMNLIPVSVLRVNDEEQETVQAIAGLLPQCDVLILSGGVSEGDHDLVKGALQSCGVIQVFHKVKQKPGKPFYFGKAQHSLVFGLPGNPAAALTCFYEYISPTLKTMMGYDSVNSNVLRLPLSADYAKKPGLTVFLKGIIQNAEVTPLPGQESYLMTAFATATCLIQLQEDRGNYQKGELVEVHPL